MKFRRLILCSCGAPFPCNVHRREPWYTVFLEFREDRDAGKVQSVSEAKGGEPQSR